MTMPLNLTLGPQESLERILVDPQLPSPPVLALQIVRKVSDPDCEVEEASNLLMQDANLCGKLLKTVNSAFFAPSRPVTSIKRAVIIAGFSRVRSLVLGLSLPAVVFHVEHDIGMQRYWKSSVTGGMIARELATHLRLLSADEDLMASLLRDLGMVLLRQVLGDAYWPVWSGQYGLWGPRQCDWEKQILGFDHAEVSARLLEKWGLPQEMVGPVRYHHDPGALPAGMPQMAKRAHLLDLASRLALLAQDDQPGEAVQDTLKVAQDQFGLDFATLEQLLGAALPKIEEFAGILQVDIGSRTDFDAILNAGVRELTRLTRTSSAPGASPRASAVGSRVQNRSGDSTWCDESVSASAAPPSETGTPVEDLASPDFRWGLEGEYSLHFTSKLGRPSLTVRLRDFELLKELGRGTSGLVLLAREPARDRLVAIKMMLPEQARIPVALKRFAREASLAAAIRHENVVGMFGVSEVRGVPFLVMEYVSGRSLQDWLDDRRVFTVQEIARIGAQIALGLAAAHKLRLIHRDIKPANILLEEKTERVRITDFGLARDIDDSSGLTRAGVLLGTPLYMSPEQVENRPLSPASDLFSLGSLLYLLCTGRSAFGRETIFATMDSILQQTPQPVYELNPAVPRWLADVINSLHAKKPADRPSAEAAAALLAQSLDAAKKC